MDLETLIPIIGGLVALGSFVLAVVEYQRQGALKRAEHFFVMRKSYREDSDFQKISDLLEDDSQELKKIPYADKRRFLGFYEEIAGDVEEPPMVMENEDQNILEGKGFKKKVLGMKQCATHKNTHARHQTAQTSPR